MTACILYGRQVSRIICVQEIESRAAREGVPASSLLPRFGSIHFIVNYVQIGGTIYSLDKFSGAPLASQLRGESISSERLILEVSTIIDTDKVTVRGLKSYNVDTCPLIEAHQHINGLNSNGTLYALTLSEMPILRRGHISKVVSQVNDETNKRERILSYFIKTIADNVSVEAMDGADELDISQSVKEGYIPSRVVRLLASPFSRLLDEVTGETTKSISLTSN
jgi:hypothetical protein